MCLVAEEQDERERGEANPGDCNNALVSKFSWKLMIA